VVAALACTGGRIRRAEELIAACEKGNAARVREMLAADPTVAQVVLYSRRGSTSLIPAERAIVTRPLPHAARSGDLGIVTLLVAHGADPNGTSFGRTPLQEAAEADAPDVVRFLLERGAEVNTKSGDFGNTALHAACANRKADVARLLLEHGAEVNARGYEGATPLHCAAGSGSMPVVAALCAAGGDPKAKDQAGNTPMKVAQDRAVRLRGSTATGLQSALQEVIPFLGPGGPCAARAHPPR
jgi:ankyrin repeat protein